VATDVFSDSGLSTWWRIGPKTYGGQIVARPKEGLLSYSPRKQKTEPDGGRRSKRRGRWTDTLGSEVFMRARVLALFLDLCMYIKKD
jgi:hypothetical protein